MGTLSKETFSEEFFIIAVAFIVAVLFLSPMFISFSAHGDARSERHQSWIRMVEQATTPEQRELVSFVRSEVEGCWMRSAVDPKFATKKNYSWRRTQVKEHELARIIAHEEACLTALRGKVRAGFPEGQDALLSIELPRQDV